jgi:hypothetical protein
VIPVTAAVPGVLSLVEQIDPAPGPSCTAMRDNATRNSHPQLSALHLLVLPCVII